LTLGDITAVGHHHGVDASKTLEPTGIEAAGLLAAVADPVRWRLLAHLAGGITTCVCDLQPIAAVAPNLLSYHLKVLREAGLVTTRRRGRWVDYTIAPDALDRLHAALPTAAALPAAATPPAAAAPPAATALPGERRSFVLTAPDGEQ
jgi:ArsR family transcriptional regulator, arsenate/arsenite/antimonite-responsive transcriptional repressor